jgi:hypothetical protein
MYCDHFFLMYMRNIRLQLSQDKQNTFQLQWNCFTRILFLHTFTQIPMMTLAHGVFSAAGMSHEGPIPGWYSRIFHVLNTFKVHYFDSSFD